jgi:DNA-binding MarR family transcriptional regulator
MASALKLEDSVVQYHVDLLVAAKLVERTGGNARFGVVYRSLTPAARQYVVERDLNK